jgi:hypothetical protein
LHNLKKRVLKRPFYNTKRPFVSIAQMIPKDDNATNEFSEELSDFCLFLYRHLLVAEFCRIIVYLSQSRLCVAISEEWSNITARIYPRAAKETPV